MLEGPVSVLCQERLEALRLLDAGAVAGRNDLQQMAYTLHMFMTMMFGLNISLEFARLAARSSPSPWLQLRC